MGFSVNTNVDALSTYANLTKVQNSLSSSLAKLSSGLRINNAGDDAAGMTISTSLASQVSGLNQASRNAQDGNSVVQTADGALSQAQSLLGRLRDLAVQAANDSNSSSARTAIKTEAASITQELTRLGNSVDFNGTKLLNGTAGTAGVLKFQVGANSDPSNDQIQVDLSTADLTKVAGQLGTAASGSLTTSSSTKTLADLAGALGGAAASSAANITFTSTSGSSPNQTVSTFKLTTNLQTTSGGTISSSANNDATTLASALNANTDFASKFTAVVQYDPTSGSPTGLGIIAKDGGAVAIKDNNATPASVVTYSSSATSLNSLDFTTSAGAQQAISAIDAQLAKVSTARANIGAAENRFASAISTISTSVTNLTAAKSRITDVDMASEMVNYSRANILSQSGTAMLAQANSLPQLALKLLQG